MASLQEFSTLTQIDMEERTKRSENPEESAEGNVDSPSSIKTMQEKPKGHSMLAPFTAGWQSIDTHPLVITNSEGIYVFDDSGMKYIDGLAGLWCTSLGGSEDRLIQAASKQLKTLPFYHSFWNRANKPSLELAHELLLFFKPFHMARVFFTNSGSEANDSMVKLVWYYNNSLGRHKKKKFIARHNCYHGSTVVAGSLSGIPYMHEMFDLPVSFVLHTDCPHYWKFHSEGETEEQYATRLTQNLENLIITEGPETIAAFVSEPVIATGGVIPPPATYFEKVQAVLQKYDILFVADEVVCAFGRLGTTCGSEKYNIKPDIMTLAKGLSSAYIPIGAVMINQKISDVILSESNKHGQLGHGFTYSGHPVACAVALETVKIYRDRNILEHVRKVAPILQDGIRAFYNSPIIGEIRGLGLIMGVEFAATKSSDKAFPQEWSVGKFFAEQCTKEGLLVRVSNDVVMLSPPLIISGQELKILISKFEVALRRAEKHVSDLRGNQQ